MKIPYPVYIVSQKLNIISQNKAANKIFKEITHIDMIFSGDNKLSIVNLIKEMHDGKEKDEFMIKENKSFYFVILKSTE